MAFAYRDNGAPMTAKGIKPMSINTASIGRKLNNMMMVIEAGCCVRSKMRAGTRCKTH